MGNALLADISSFQTVSDWNAYAAWSKQGDGTARVIMRAAQGVGVPDTSFNSFWNGAVGSGMDLIVPYHFAYPNLHPGGAGAAQEANWFASVVGNRLRANDFVMLDLEQFESAAWAHAFHDALPAALLQNKPVLYDSLSHFQQFFAADLALAAKFDCVLAAWYPLQNGPPAVPAGWQIRWWQWTDNQAPNPIMSVPGMSMPVDLNLWLGGASVAIPTGPFVARTFGDEIPPSVSWQALASGFGLSDADFLAIPGNAFFAGYDSNPASVQGLVVHVPGYDPPVAPVPPALTPAQQAWLDAGPVFKAALAGI